MTEDVKYLVEQNYPVGIPLTKGYVTWVDGEDLARVAEKGGWVTTIKNLGYSPYATSSLTKGSSQRKISLHQFVLGKVPEFDIDHINGDGLDNRKNNLRYATKSQNLANHTKLQKRNTSGFYGVSWDKARHRWMVRVGKIHFGRYDDAIDAARAYDIAAQKIYGKFASLNFPSTEATSALRTSPQTQTPSEGS